MRLRWSEIVAGHRQENGAGAEVLHRSRVETIVAFLALLELVKRGAVATVQHGHFEDIHIENAEVGVPVYG
jgi:chromatin segregation and condensation protein Rec8/ScpA/Scc1 (kleisin family)